MFFYTIQRGKEKADSFFLVQKWHHGKIVRLLDEYTYNIYNIYVYRTVCTRKEVSEWPSILSLLRNKGGHFYNLTVRRPTKNSLLLQYGAPQKRLKKATRFPPKTGDIHHMCVFFWILFQKRGNLCSVEGNFLIGDEQTWENRRDKEKSKEKKKKKRERDFVFLSSFLFPFFWFIL